MFCRVMIQGKMLGRLLSLLVDEDNHRVSQKAVSPIPGLVAGGANCRDCAGIVSNRGCRLLGLGMTAAISLTLAS